MNLKSILKIIKDADENQHYHARYVAVFDAIQAALALGYAAGFRIDPQETEWPCAFIELPTGQISFHMPQHTTPWDGHTTEEKYARIKEFAEA